MEARDGALHGISILVVGAGLAGLAAAHDLMAMGATVLVVEARDRVGGRVQTVRDGFSDGQHAEAGGDLIDAHHHEIRRLAAELGLKVTRVLREGWSHVLPDAHGEARPVRRTRTAGWARLAEAITDRARPYRLAEGRWDSPVAADLARHSLAQWLDDIQADDELRATAAGLRSFFLADPEDLSLLAVIEHFAADDSATADAWFRIAGGNDRLCHALAAPLGDRLRLGTTLAAVSHRGTGVRASLVHDKVTTQVQTDYAVLAIPAPLLRRVPITPALPSPQHTAIARLKYGRVTKTLLQFSASPWRKPGRGRAFGSPLAFGAVWDGNEEQRGKAGILSLVAGGSASEATRALVARNGVAGLVRTLTWTGARPDHLTASRQFTWDAEPWSRGGYAYFDPAFDPAHRAWLSRPTGPLVFAGEHTSIASQGYMNGAVESGRRAAVEIAALARLRSAV